MTDMKRSTKYLITRCVTASGPAVICNLATRTHHPLELLLLIPDVTVYAGSFWMEKRARDRDRAEKAEQETAKELARTLEADGAVDARIAADLTEPGSEIRRLCYRGIITKAEARAQYLKLEETRKRKPAVSPLQQLNDMAAEYQLEISKQKEMNRAFADVSSAIAAVQAEVLRNAASVTPLNPAKQHLPPVIMPDWSVAPSADSVCVFVNGKPEWRSLSVPYNPAPPVSAGGGLVSYVSRDTSEPEAELEPAEDFTVPENPGLPEIPTPEQSLAGYEPDGHASVRYMLSKVLSDELDSHRGAPVRGGWVWHMSPGWLEEVRALGHPVKNGFLGGYRVDTDASYGVPELVAGK